jgi:hypothetical protein
MAVSVEYEDVLFLGEIRHCNPNNDGSFHVEIDVKHILNSLTMLLRLRASLLEANTPTQLDSRPECVGRDVQPDT